MKKTIFFKLFSSIFLLIVLLSGLIFVFSINTVKHHYINTFTYELKNLTDVLSPTVTPLVESGNLTDLNDLIKRIGKRINTRITVIAPDGKVLADSKENADSMENHRGRPEIREAIATGFGKSVRYSTTEMEEMLYVAIPMKSNGKLIGVLRTSLFLRDIDTLLNSLRNRLLYSIVIITLLSLLVAFMISKNISSPIKELAEASKNLANGDFSTHLRLIRNDELGELAESFNIMSEKLKSVFDELTSKKEEFKSIISSLSEGLMVIDKTGKIILCNDSFKRIVSANPLDKFYWEILREPVLLNSIEKEIGESRHIADEIELNGKKYLFSFSSVPETEELIVILHDITKFKNLEKIKKDFIANVSHELRTPLTAIKGYLETMEDEEGTEYKRYLDIVQRHTERLINIVNDLLQLSELEQKGIIGNLEKIDLKDTVENVFRIFKQKAEKKNIRLILDTPDSVFFYGDPFKLEQMFVNLIDNAIKYTESGNVTVSLNIRDKRVIINVSDTGIGIPERHLDRIFERFYVVDKSRSRRGGGTGLGLSIVKHIVLLHNGKIKVWSKRGKGTTFTITLPMS